MCNVKCVVVPVIIGTTGMGSRRWKEKFGKHARKTFSGYSAKGSCTGNMTCNGGDGAV